MRPLVFRSFTTVNALGRGLKATFQALHQRQSGLRPCDFEDAKLDAYIGRVEGLEQIQIAQGFEEYDCRNNRLALLGLQQDDFAKAVGEAREQYGPNRIAVIIGTSTSGLLETEHAYRVLDKKLGAFSQSFYSRSRATHCMFSVADFVRRYLDLAGPAIVISTACSSSAKVFASASRLIEAGICEGAVVGGVDSLCLNTLYGFSSLELVAKGPCRPCDVARDGLSIGEAAGFVLLTGDEAYSRSEAISLLGYGESCDGYHMAHPHPEGLGAVLAMRCALERASLRACDIDYVHLHGTGTKANDAIEDKAVTAVFGAHTPCSSTKGWTGHALGAAGAVEVIISALCIKNGLVPGTVNTQIVDPELQSHVLLENREQAIKYVLTNLFGFGGSNCSLVLGTT